ncbi:MAG: hypothetical protein JWQ95_557 [Sphaerisporangium sp.]|jgi:uncharacterized membrane protein YoaK (UPF0700 family)|nr:hypothetical protein [Sphaerisporangium sp.]
MVVLLALNSGLTDAAGYLALGGAFSSVMTGNMVLLGLSVGSAAGTLVLHAGAAVLAFVCGCAIGTRVAGTARAGDPIWPRAVTRALVLQAAAVGIYAVAWWGTAGQPGPALQLALLALNALALGVQSSAVQRFGVPGLSTTYLTGTLTTVVIRLISGRPPREIRHSLVILMGLITGAVIGTLLVVHARIFLPAAQLGLLGLVVFRVATRDSELSPVK